MGRPATPSSEETRTVHWATPGCWMSLGVQPYEKMNAGLIKAAIAEFWVTTLFLFVTIGTICNGCTLSDFGAKNSSYGPNGVLVCPMTNARVVEIAAAFGFTIAVLVYVAASFSGGHINPAITLAFAVTKRISLLRAFLYLVAQVGGAIVGSALVYAMNRAGWEGMAGGTNAVKPGQSLASIWLLEFMLTSLLVFVVFAATDDDRGETASHLPILAPFAIGFTVFVCHLCAIPLDGCSINPARSLGPAVISGHFQYHWLFWVGPLSGGVFGGLIYEFIFRLGSHAKLIIPGSGLEAGSDEADKAALPPYAGVEGVEQVENRHFPRGHGRSNDQGVKLPAFSGVAGVKQSNDPHLPTSAAHYPVPSNGPRQMPATGGKGVQPVQGAGRNPEAVRLAGQELHANVERLGHTMV